MTTTPTSSSVVLSIYGCATVDEYVAACRRIAQPILDTLEPRCVAQVEEAWARRWYEAALAARLARLRPPRTVAARGAPTS